jgi:DNA-binding CsgD family transcriptional regulator
MEAAKYSTLTKRERDVLARAGRGLTNQEIGEELMISTRTVKCTLHRASARLGARNRTQAVLMAIRRGELNILDMFSVDDLREFLASLPPELMIDVCRSALRTNSHRKVTDSAVKHERGNGSKEKARGEVECVY